MLCVAKYCWSPPCFTIFVCVVVVVCGVFPVVWCVLLVVCCVLIVARMWFVVCCMDCRCVLWVVVVCGCELLYIVCSVMPACVVRCSLFLFVGYCSWLVALSACVVCCCLLFVVA